ncbi:MAG: hypothetical protein ACHQ49_02935 [Elusimicrobiota bacterium]
MSEGGKLALKADEIYVVTHTRFEEMDRKLRLLSAVVRLAEKRRRQGRDLVIVDWGAGEGRTLATLKEELERRGIKNVKYYGYSAQYFPQWEKLPAGIGMVLDVPGNLPRRIGGKADIVYSHYGLHLLAHERARTPERRDPSHFAELRGMLAPDGELRTTNAALPLGAIEAFGFKASRIPVKSSVWSDYERRTFKLTSTLFTPEPK